jgi:hypothetical protein
MLRSLYGPFGRISRFCAARIWMAVMLLAPLPAATSQTSGFRPPVVTSFRHANTVKRIDSLDWIGLYEQLEPYSRWWKETAACAGIPLPASRPDSVQFYYINAPEFVPAPIEKGNKMVAGITYAASEQIYISILRARDQITVKHEMLHQILYWWGETNWHDDARPEFRRCGLQIDS